MGLDVVRLVRQRPFVGRRCLQQLALRLQGIAQVVVERRRPAVVRNRLLDQLHRGVMTTELVRDDTEQVQRVGVAAIRLQNLPVEPLGFQQASSRRPA